MSEFNNRSQNSARRGDYVWQYEYYDDEEPVSFEGLKAHRCKLITTTYIKKLLLLLLFLQYVCVRAFHCMRLCVSCLCQQINHLYDC